MKKEREKNTTDKTPIAQGILSKAKETLKNGTQLHQCQWTKQEITITLNDFFFNHHNVIKFRIMNLWTL